MPARAANWQRFAKNSYFIIPNSYFLPSSMSRVISLVVLLVLVAIFGALFYLVVYRFFLPLFLAALLAVLFRPLRDWITARARGYDRIAAGVTTAAILLIVLLPTALVTYKAAHDAVGLVRTPGKLKLDHQSIDNLIRTINDKLSLELQPDDIRVELTEKINAWLGPIAARTPGVVFDFLIGFFVLILALYYFLADGREMMATLTRLIPLDQQYQQRLIGEFEEVSRAVVSAHLLAGAAQTVLAGIGFYFAGLGSIFLLMMLTFVGSMIPFVGAAAVWISASLWLVFVEDRQFAGILLALYGVGIISMVDNLIKPLVLHGQSKLNPLLAVLSVLGGVQALGPIGIFVGPMAVAFLQAGLNMLHSELLVLGQDTPPVAATPPIAPPP